MRRALAVLAVLLVVCVVWLRLRDPETRELDDAARSGVPGSFVHLADGVTHYEVAGPVSGARVVLVHGFSVPAYIWDSTFVALTGAGFRVARYDVYGRGWSDRPDATYDAAMFDRQLTQLLDSLGWREPVNVGGLSFGGLVTAAFVASHPERVRSWVLVDPVAPSDGGGTPAYFTWPVVGPLLWQGLAVPTMDDGQLSDFVEPAKWPDWVERYRVQMQFRGFGRALLRSRVASASVSLDSLYRRAGAAGVPTLLIWGKEDKTVPIAGADSLRKAMPQLEYHPIDRAGHLPHMERTDVVNPLLIDFLRRHQGGAPASPADSATLAARPPS
jgi:pimeloyl-ACP methyl ester carboxylesterase